MVSCLPFTWMMTPTLQQFHENNWESALVSSTALIYIYVLKMYWFECKCVNFKIWSLRILWCKNFKNLIQIFYLSDVRSTEKKFNSIFPETNVYCDLMKFFVSHALMECVDVYHTFKSIIIRWRYSLSSLTKVFSVKGIDKP